MDTPSFHDLRRQASFFFKEKIKTARLVLTDATPAQLCRMTEEATSGNTWAPDTPTLRSISRAAFEIDDYTRIVEILHKRFLKFERKNWRVSYNSLIVLERLLTHGPESVAGEFQSDKVVISEMESFHHIDEKGFDWGLAVRKKSERILKLLEKGPLLKEERDRARNVTRGIQGFGSFSLRSSTAQGMLTESSLVTTYGRSNSQFNNQKNEENQLSISTKGLTKEVQKSQQRHEVITFQSGNKVVNEKSWGSLCNRQVLEKAETQVSYKENVAPKKEELHRWNFTGESNPLLDGKKNEPRIEMSMEEDHHPFTGTENQSTASLLMQIPTEIESVRIYNQLTS